jgi:hypothetical protein
MTFAEMVKTKAVTQDAIEGLFEGIGQSFEKWGDKTFADLQKTLAVPTSQYKTEAGPPEAVIGAKKKLIEWSSLQDEFSKVDYTLSEAQQLSWWQAKLKIPLEPEARTKILDIINRLNFDINKAGQESYNKANEDFLKGQDVVSKALADMNTAYIKSVSLPPTMLPSGEMEQLYKPRAIPLPQDQAGLMEERMSRSVESITQLADSIGANAPKLNELGAITEANAVSIGIMNKEIEKSAMVFEDTMRNSWDPFYNANVDLKGELDKSKVSFDNWTKANIKASDTLYPISANLEVIQKKYQELYEYADQNGLDKVMLQKSEAKEIEDAMSGIGLSMNKTVEDWHDLLDDLSGSESQEKIKSWSDKVKDGVYKIEGAFDSLRSVFGLFISDTQSSLSMSGWASQVQGIGTDIANSATDTADKLIDAQKSYEERIADIQKTRTEGLTNAEGKYELGMSFSDRLIQQQDERDAQIKIEKDYKEQMAEAEKDYAKEKATIEADRVKSEKDSKDAELKIIAEFQKSKLSALDQEKIDVNDNYTELKKLYEKYGYDTVQLEKDRQKALKDIKYQGYVDDLDKLSGWVTDTKTILSGVKDAWDSIKWAKEKYDQLTVKKPTVTGGGTGGVTGGGTSALGGIGAAVAIGTGEYYIGKEIAKSSKALSAYEENKGGLKTITNILQPTVGWGIRQGAHEQRMALSERDATNLPMGLDMNSSAGKQARTRRLDAYYQMGTYDDASYREAYKRIWGYYPANLPYVNRENQIGVATMTAETNRGTPATTIANQAPSANLNINFNLAPSQQQIDGLTRDVELSARKQGFRVKVGRNA